MANVGATAAVVVMVLIGGIQPNRALAADRDLPIVVLREGLSRRARQSTCRRATRRIGDLRTRRRASRVDHGEREARRGRPLPERRYRHPRQRHGRSEQSRAHRLRPGRSRDRAGLHLLFADCCVRQSYAQQPGPCAGARSRARAGTRTSSGVQPYGRRRHASTLSGPFSSCRDSLRRRQ